MCLPPDIELLWQLQRKDKNPKDWFRFLGLDELLKPGYGGIYMYRYVYLYIYIERERESASGP